MILTNLFLIFQAMDVVIEKEDFYSLVELLEQFSHKWRMIARTLLLSGSEISYIEREHKMDYNCLTEVLRIFFDQRDQPTVGELNRALRRAGIRDMTSQIIKSLLSYRRQIIGKLSIQSFNYLYNWGEPKRAPH